MDKIINWFKSTWAVVSAFFVDAFDYLKNLYLKVFDFLVETMGHTVAVIQVSIVGALLLLFLVLLIIAIINPKKRRTKKLAKIYKKQRVIEDLRHQITQTVNEISSIDLEIALEKKNSSDEIFNLTEEEKLLASQETAVISKGQGRIEELAQKQKVLNEYLKNQQSGIFKSMKKAETTKQLISDLDAEKNEYSIDVSKRTLNLANRKKELETKINQITAESDQRIYSLTQKRKSFEAQKLDLETRLKDLVGSDKYKLTLDDAKTITDEYAKQKRIADKETEDKALEELRKAKLEYEIACKKRVQTEKETSLAIENVKSTQKERAKTKTSKKIKFAPVTTATAVRSDEKPKDVNIIIADINSETVTVKEPEEKPIETVEVDRSYAEPIVEIVDVKNLTEEEVVFIEAILEDINFDVEENEETYEEVAVSSTLSAVETEDNKVETPVEEEISTENANETLNASESKSANAVTTKKPQYKDYGDGIPATPIGKKTKYQKPITKLIKKNSTQKKVLTQINEQTAIKERVAYSGKWEICNTESGANAKLIASNGTVMIETPKYATVKGLIDCIENVKSALNLNNVTVEEIKKGKYVFKILSQKGRVIVKSAEYDSKAQCEKSLDSTARFAKTAIICE